MMKNKILIIIIIKQKYAEHFNYKYDNNILMRWIKKNSQRKSLGGKIKIWVNMRSMRMISGQDYKR